MNIGIFETEHFEGAYPVIRLFDTPENRLTIFTDVQTHRRFKDLLQSTAGRFEWVIGNETANRFLFFKKMYSAARKAKLDIVYINTISKNHLLYALMIKFLPASRAVLTIHDINCFFQSRRGTGFREWIQHTGKKMLLKNLNEFNVVADTMVPYLRSKTTAMIHNVPGAVYEHRASQNQLRDKIHLVVPGTIDQKRRDYNAVFELLSLAEQKAIPLHITLLGGALDDYGRSVLKKVRDFRGQATGISCYDFQLVDQDEFDLQLDAAHFIFVPSVVNTFICGKIPETYGLTKSSGNIFDIIKHAKPFIAPKGLLVSPELEDSWFAYGKVDEIIPFLQSMLNTAGLYEQWSENAIRNSEKFTIDKVRKKNPSLFS